ncbi:MAG: VWA domain-containing protein [Phormidium sp. BM_Day4_Bin.17]|nr:VWA domain-containing protein [Phormidium sp. BM_Day4_Bin.17]UCJ14476.1 MAG: VWA domain-containing protein [Phormidium sp. PBR-2020]
MGRPQIENDRVKLRVQVTDDNDRPVMQLQEEQFEVLVDGDPITVDNWRSPEESQPPPAWIVVLLDYTGSMNQKDTGGQTRIASAIAATRRFLSETRDRGGDTRVAILPFGVGGGTCEGHDVTREGISQRFFSPGDVRQENLLSYLESETPCASTDIYGPVNEAVRLLANRDDERFYLPEDSSEPDPRLSVILLSDGYHNRPNGERDFENLMTLLNRENHITVHTLGYGYTQEQLGQMFDLGRPATIDDVQTSNNPDNPVPAELFVEEEPLQQMSEATGGIAEFSGNEDDISQALRLFLDALLGEYELSYQETADRGEIRQVQVQVDVNNEEVVSEKQSYTVPVFGRSLPLGTRLTMTGFLLILLGFGGVLPFYLWGQKLKRDAEEDF